LPNSRAASLKTFLWPGLLPQKTQTLLNLLLGLPSSIHDCFSFCFSIQSQTIEGNKSKQKGKLVTQQQIYYFNRKDLPLIKINVAKKQKENYKGLQNAIWVDSKLVRKAIEFEN
jgi:hypothetical protein